jgi:hypothetical protein
VIPNKRRKYWVPPRYNADVPEPEPGTYARLRQDLATAEAGVLKILEAAPRALYKYGDAGAAGRAVRDALERAVRQYSDGESRWVRYKRERQGR